MSRSDRSSPQEKSLGGRIRRWIRRRRRERKIRAEELRIAKELAAKARAREIRELQKTSPENESAVPRVEFSPTQPVTPLQEDPESKLVRSKSNPAPVPTGSVPAIPVRGLLDHWKRYREVRRQQLQQKRLARQIREADALKARERKKKSSFGVGSTELSASDVRIPYRQRPVYIFRLFYRRFVKQRIPHWLAAMSPALIMLLAFVIPAIIESRGNAAVAIPEYRERWSEAFRAGRWKIAELAGLRVISSRQSETQDDLAYFDTLVANGEYQKAVRQLISKESAQRELMIAEFRYEMADRFLTRLEGSQELTDLSLRKLAESLSGPLSLEKQIKARKVLASASAIQGDLAGALAMLQPIRSVDLVSHCDSLWLGWNMNPDIMSEAFSKDVRGSLQQISDRIEKQPVLDPQDIAARARMSSLLGEEKPFLDWVEKENRLSADEKSRWIREFENLSLVRILRAAPLDPNAAWSKLRQVLDREPNNLEMIDTAIGLSIGPPERTSKDARDWVLQKLRSEPLDPKILARVSMSAHAANQWPLAIECYEKLTKIDPENTVALNNLAGIYYKIPPYQLDKALSLVDRALAGSPGNISFLETRGQILARMGRVEEARSILENCLATFPNEWNLHNTLAQIYDYEGKASLAAVHREKLSELKKPSNSPVEDRIVFPKRPPEAARSENP